MTRSRYTVAQRGGDDALSWAVLDNGRPVATGLSRDEAQRLARRENGETRSTVRAVRLPHTVKVSQGRGRPRLVCSIYAVRSGRGWDERTHGYVVGFRGSWWECSRLRPGLPVGPTFATVREAAEHVASPLPA
jgi:hypothetical protein